MVSEKFCPNCKTTKNANEFGKDAKTGDGMRWCCKACKKSKDKEYRDSHHNEIKTYQQLVRQQKRYRNRYGIKYKHTVQIGVKRWLNNHPGAQRAHKVVYAAVKNGQLPHVSTCKCANCSAPAEHYHHHLGYDKVHMLDVVPLCIECHRREHSI